MYEHRSKPLLPRRAFVARVMGSAGIGVALIAVSLGIGMLGYGLLGHLGLADSFLNASMILSGMGPIASLEGNTPAKIFAGIYALFSGFALITIAAIIFAPIVHRFLHRFHLEIHESRKN